MEVSKESPAYKIALELELWKDLHRSEVETLMKRTESELIDKNMQEYRQNQSQMISEIESNKAFCEKIVQEYNGRLSTLDKRERSFDHNFSSLRKLEEEFSAEKLHQTVQTREKSKNKNEVLAVEIDLLNNKILDLESSNMKLKSSLQLIENAIEKKNISLNTVQESPSVEPSLSQNISLVKMQEDLSQLRSRVAKLAQTKERYKLKLQRVLGEFTRPQDPPDEIPPRVVDSAPPEIPQSCSLAAELEQIVSTMKEEKLATPRLVDNEKEIEDLIRERNTLMETGVYLSSDMLITQIDQRIKELLAAKN